MLLERIPPHQFVHCAWALLLHCAANRANYQLRVVWPEHGGVRPRTSPRVVAVSVSSFFDISPVSQPHYPCCGRVEVAQRDSFNAVSFLGELGGDAPDGLGDTPSLTVSSVESGSRRCRVSLRPPKLLDAIWLE